MKYVENEDSYKAVPIVRTHRETVYKHQWCYAVDRIMKKKKKKIDVIELESSNYESKCFKGWFFFFIRFSAGQFFRLCGGRKRLTGFRVVSLSLVGDLCFRRIPPRRFSKGCWCIFWSLCDVRTCPLPWVRGPSGVWSVTKEEVKIT